MSAQGRTFDVTNSLSARAQTINYFRKSISPEMTTTAFGMEIVSEINNMTATARDGRLAKIEIGVQAFIFIMALIGNVCVLLALRYRKMKTSRMHLLIMHLSVADLLVATFNVLPQLAWDATFRFMGSDPLCRFVKYMQVMVIYLSTYVLVITAVDRYRSICQPLSSYSWTPRKVHRMVGIAWLCAAFLSIPQVIIFRQRELAPGEFDCWAHFHPGWTLQLYITSFTLTVYIIPFAVLVILYGRICHEVWKNVRHSTHGNLNGVSRLDTGKITYKFNGSGHICVIQDQSSQNDRSSSQRLMGIPRRHTGHNLSSSKLKTIKLTIVVILAYLICWSPFMITQMWWAYDETAPHDSYTFVICLLLANLNSCCNPWIYMAFSGNLLQHVFHCCKRHRLPEAGNELVPRRLQYPLNAAESPLFRGTGVRPRHGLTVHVPLEDRACNGEHEPAHCNSRTSCIKGTWGIKGQSRTQTNSF